MAQQERKRKREKEPPKKEEVSSNPKIFDKGKKIKEDLDRLLDEIDDVLEKNAEEFVKNYIQKGGQ